MESENAALNKVTERIRFVTEIDKLKLVLRRTKLICADRPENDAEHSWHLAIMALVFADLSNEKIDLLKVIKMLLIHDLVEIDAGDTFIYDSVATASDKLDKERLAAERIFGLLPKPLSQELMDLWLEFEDGITPESKFAKAMDRFEPLLQNVANKGGTWREYDVPYETVHLKKSVIEDGSAAIWRYVCDQLDSSVKNGFLRRRD